MKRSPDTIYLNALLQSLAAEYSKRERGRLIAYIQWRRIRAAQAKDIAGQRIGGDIHRQLEVLKRLTPPPFEEPTTASGAEGTPPQSHPASTEPEDRPE